jgi:hypothetical protein
LVVIPIGVNRLHELLLSAFSHYGNNEYLEAVQEFSVALQESELYNTSQIHIILTGRAATYAAQRLFNSALKVCSFHHSEICALFMFTQFSLIFSFLLSFFLWPLDH